MKIIADTNTFIAVALNEPEKDRIIRLTEGHDLIAPDVLPFEVGNALTAMMKKNALKIDGQVRAALLKSACQLKAKPVIHFSA